MQVHRHVTKLIKNGLLRSPAHRIIAPFEQLLRTSACLGDFLRWCYEHPTKDLGAGDDARFHLYEEVVAQTGLAAKPLTYLEFGVFRGESIRWWVERNSAPQSQFLGFDTFTGLPERWGGMDVGGFSTEGETPDVSDPRCRFVKGLFQDTVPPALEQAPMDRQLVLHFDADLFSSTLFALYSVAPHLKPGDILMFDEFNSLAHEFRAFRDFETSFPIEYRALGSAQSYTKLALEVTACGAASR